MGEQKTKKVSEEDALKEAEKTLKDIKTGKEKPISQPKTEIGQSQTKSVDRGEAKTKTSKKPPKIRSQKYKKALILVDRSKLYSLDEAVDLVKKTSYSKFDGSVEMHVRLGSKKGGEPIAFRKLISLAHQAGKEPKIAIIDEALIEKISKEKKADYDILLATPEIMPKLAKIARILGPQGKMPNPKSGTVTKEPQKVIQDIKSGKIEIKTDKQGNIHQVLGKVSWEDAKLKENISAVLASLSASQIVGATLCASMGPGIKVKI